MIYLVDGTPGGGKSFWATRWIADGLAKGLPIATNVPLVPDYAEQLAKQNLLRRWRPGAIATRAAEYRTRVLVSQDIDELMRVHVPGRGEGRWRLVLDEAHRVLNSRSWNDKARADRIAWFSGHRHYGADVALLTQYIDMIDKQIRHLVEHRVRVRNLAKVRKLGFSVTMGRPYFVAVHELHGSPSKEIVRREFYPLDKRVRGIYDTHGLAVVDAPAGAIILPHASAASPPVGPSDGFVRAPRWEGA